jgi:hypothetical protein
MMKEQLMLGSCINDLLAVYIRDTKAAIKRGTDTTFDERDPEDEFTTWIQDRLISDILEQLDWERIKDQILNDKEDKDEDENEDEESEGWDEEETLYLATL